MKLTRPGASEPIATHIMDWKSVHDATLYFYKQGVDRIPVLNKFELRSCTGLGDTLSISMEKLAQNVADELQKLRSETR